MTQKSNFFAAPKPHSLIKIEIVEEYFGAWAKIMSANCKKLTYLDLFSGPGVYADGTESTPVKVLNRIETEPYLLQNLKTHFYESNKLFSSQLKDCIRNHSAYGKLRHKPIINAEEVNKKLVPNLPIDNCTFSFVDPHGYHISLDLLSSVIGNWGSDCIFYLSTSGIRRNIENEDETDKLIDLFGEEGLKELRAYFENNLSWFVKDRLILNQLSKALNREKKVYFLNFGMEFEEREMVSYYLIFISKHHLGFAIMKDIMAKEKHCVFDSSGIPIYLYSKNKLERNRQMELQFEEKMPTLKKLLCRGFEARTLKVKEVLVACHKAGYIYTGKNMKDAMLILEDEDKLQVDQPRNKRIRSGKPTLGNDRIVTFRCRE